MQAKIEEASVSEYVDYALRLRQQVDYLVGRRVDSTMKESVVNTIWAKSLTSKEYYKAENRESVSSDETAAASKIEDEKPGNRDDQIAEIKKLIVKNKNNLPVLEAYSDFSRKRKVEDMTSEERRKAIKILGGN